MHLPILGQKRPMHIHLYLLTTAPATLRNIFVRGYDSSLTLGCRSTYGTTYHFSTQDLHPQFQINTFNLRCTTGRKRYFSPTAGPNDKGPKQKKDMPRRKKSGAGASPRHGGSKRHLPHLSSNFITSLLKVYASWILP